MWNNRVNYLIPNWWSLFKIKTKHVGKGTDRVFVFCMKKSKGIYMYEKGENSNNEKFDECWVDVKWLKGK